MDCCGQPPHIFKSLIHHLPINVYKLNHIMVFIWLPFITNTSINWNLQHPPPHFFPGSSLGIWVFKDWFVEISTPRKNIVFKCPTNFWKGKISKHDFLHIDRALKPKPSIPFFWAIFTCGSELFTSNFSTFKYIFIFRKTEGIIIKYLYNYMQLSLKVIDHSM